MMEESYEGYSILQVSRNQTAFFLLYGVEKDHTVDPRSNFDHDRNGSSSTVI